jgi:hypothetical protein
MNSTSDRKRAGALDELRLVQLVMATESSHGPEG